jgi:tRNA 2-thiouridine synthesizing protein A
MTEFNHELDACGLNCPLPVLRTKKTLDKMASGEVLQIIATDPGPVRRGTSCWRPARRATSTTFS